ncbi:MAG: hypothetical protein FVQ04_05030 [Nitrospira sp.]|nr:hypothetical protein [Nitrospira sp.]
MAAQTQRALGATQQELARTHASRREAERPVAKLQEHSAGAGRDAQAARWATSSKKGGFAQAATAARYAQNQPVASNETLEGRAENRPIAIVPDPKVLSEIVHL